MTNRTPLMAGNWKMNLDLVEGERLVRELAVALEGHDATSVEVAVIPPFVNIQTVRDVTSDTSAPLVWGAQDLSAHAGSGAYTGEVSGSMLSALGCTYVLVGHSERREYHGEDESVTNAKVRAALAQGLVPVLCVGEPLEVRKAGEQVSHTLAQVDGGLEGLSEDDAAKVVIAYEPVWAIGTGEVATPADAQEVCGAIRKRLAELFSDSLAEGARILYGGSVKAANVAEIMAEQDVDGALVGGASLKADEFAGIARYRERS